MPRSMLCLIHLQKIRQLFEVSMMKDVLAIVRPRWCVPYDACQSAGGKTNHWFRVAILQLGKLPEQFRLIIEHGVQHLFRDFIVRMLFEVFEPLLDGLVQHLQVRLEIFAAL